MCMCIEVCDSDTKADDSSLFAADIEILLCESGVSHVAPYSDAPTALGL